MTAVIAAVGVLVVCGLLLTPQLVRAIGVGRGTLIGLAAVGGVGGIWWWLALPAPNDGAPGDWAKVESASSETCAKCHADHYESWHRTYHRTMTRNAAADTVKGDFDNCTYEYQGIATKLTREGDKFFMTTVDPNWSMAKAKGIPANQLGPPRFTKLSVDRTIGSHWVQEYLHGEGNGRFTRLPVLYHIVEKKWVHSHGAFLAPESPDFWAKCRSFSWNDTCLYCHNTGPVKNPLRGQRGDVVGYKTEVAELGISCEACHGPGGDHVRLNHNPARRLNRQFDDEPDPSIVNPLRLSVPRRDEICARCHGSMVPRPEKWDSRTHRDPFIAGQELGNYNHFFWSEAQQAELMKTPKPDHDGRYWGDGTPLTTALEYNGMAKSACYQNGQGQMSCLSCHELHGKDPNHLLKPAMRGNEACLQCHGEYREKLSEHTKHPTNSAASQCMNCHMPHVVFSLLTTHRSHRIENPDLRGSVGTGKPNACNLCHLDKSLGWTREQLARWPGQAKKPAVKLSDDEERIPSSILMLATGDARSRAIVAAAFGNPEAQRASGTKWMGRVVAEILEVERYPMVRLLLHRGLKSVHGEAVEPYDYLALPEQRSAQLVKLRSRLREPGVIDDATLRRLLSKRTNQTDPDVTINE